jgi:glucosylceramidase
MMIKTIKMSMASVAMFTMCLPAMAQTQTIWVQTTDGNPWQISTVSEKNISTGKADIVLDTNNDLLTFKGWGITFNELGWDALNLLKVDEQQDVISRLFSPKGDMRFTIGRVPLGANDYARSWYSCDETDSDFTMAHFNIDRDKQSLIPFIKLAQAQNPDMTFWISPWSPPTWLKTNKHYANRSGGNNGLSSANQVPLYTDQVIQKPEYLQAYALYFSKFIDAYKQQQIPITAVCYQNEAYSFTIYPGCSWSTDGIIRFNYEYLKPQLKTTHPEVEIWLGTMNQGNAKIFEQILANNEQTPTFNTVGYQWEGASALPVIKHKYPNLPAVQTESECGSGTFDWGAAEHTFDLIHYYISNGCEKYTYWNPILKDKGASTWGWLQNSLIHVNSSAKTYTYTSEYYAMMHNTHFVSPGSVLIDTRGGNMPMMAFRTPDNAIVVIVGNKLGSEQRFWFQHGNHSVSATLKAKSFNTFVCADSRTETKLLAEELNNLHSSMSADMKSKIADICAQASNINSTTSDEQIKVLQTSMDSILDIMMNRSDNGTVMDSILVGKTPSMANPVDVTAAIRNPSFHSGDTPNAANGNSTGWNTNNVATSGDFRLNYIANRNCWNSWSNNFTSMNLYQNMSGMKPGSYIVSCSLMCGPGEIHDQHVYATSSLNTAISPTMTVAIWNTDAGWGTVTSDTVIVGDDGKLRIGVASTSGGGTSGWFCATDFKLSYLGSTTSTYDNYKKIYQRKLESLTQVLDSAVTETKSRALSKQFITTHHDILNSDTVTLSSIPSLCSMLSAVPAYFDFLQKAQHCLADSMATYSSDAIHTLQNMVDAQGSEIVECRDSIQVMAMTNALKQSLTAFLFGKNDGSMVNVSAIISAGNAQRVDMNYIPEGWNVARLNGDAYTKTGLYYDGDINNRYFDSYNKTAGALSYTGWQTLRDVPNGIYTLSCIGRTDGTGVYLMAETNGQRLVAPVPNCGMTGGSIWESAAAGSAVKNVNTGLGYGWSAVTLSDIPVTDHTLTIGFTNESVLTGYPWTGTWFSTDDYQLYYKSNATVGITEQVASTPQLVDVYSINGMRVRSHVNEFTAITGLPKGVYIIDNRKVFCK